MSKQGKRRIHYFPASAIPIADCNGLSQGREMGPLLYTLLAFFGGILLAVQAPTNALLAKGFGSPIFAALISFAVGSAALLLILPISGVPRAIPAFRSLPWYVWLGGIYGAYFVAMATLVAPRLGIGALLTAAVAGQLAAALILDHYGFFGLEPRPATFARVLGLLLVFAGAILVRRG